MEMLKKLIFFCVLNPFKKCQPLSGTSLLSLLSGVREWNFTNKCFPCPCTRKLNLLHSIFYLIVSPLLILLLGCAFNEQAQWFMIGYYTPSQVKDEGSKIAWNRYIRKLRSIWPILVATFFWISVALMEGDYYECAFSASLWVSRQLCPGQETNCTQQLPLVPCQKEKPLQFQEFFQDLKAIVQILGCSLIALVLFVVAISWIITARISSVNHQCFERQKLDYLKEREMMNKESKNAKGNRISISLISDEMSLLPISSSGLQCDSILQESEN
ncbi:calcium homeostasis modulator protein 6-like [Macrotis lagotis]|uniref:calcium homeostasis modulator protein 6-like n=1 Tax=Macrotis lagotis TaxID=92651 RepID=UPI003D69E480